MQKFITCVSTWLILLCAFISIQGQIESSYSKRLAIASDQKNVETQIYVEVTDPDVKKVVLLEQKTYKPIGVEEVDPNKRNLYFKVTIEKNTSNNFILMYEKQDGKPQQMQSISIFGQELSAVAGNGGGSSNGNNQVGNNSGGKPNEKKDSKIKIADSTIVTDESEYTLPLDVSDLDKKAAEFEVTVINEDSRGKKQSSKKQVAIKKKEDEIVSPQNIPLKLKQGENTLEILALDKDGKKIEKSENKVDINCFKCDESNSTVSVNSLYARAIVGFQQTGASSSTSSQKPFLNFFFTAPIIRYKDTFTDKEGNEKQVYFFPKLSLWGDLRFTSIVQQQAASNIGLSNFATSFLPTGTDGDLNDLVQSFEVLSGLEWKVLEPEKATNLFGVRQKTMVSLIAAAGFSNPLTSRNSAQIFKVPDDEEFIKAFPQAEGKENIAFIQGERDRFFRQYYAGFRFRTMHYDENNIPLNYSPAIFDVTVGQNESITESLKGVILRLDGFYPFPIKKADYLYFYGSAQLKLGKRVDRNILPFILEPAGNVNIFEENTAVVQINESPFLRSSRDRYSLGIGIDFIKLYKRLTEKKTTP